MRHRWPTIVLSAQRYPPVHNTLNPKDDWAKAQFCAIVSACDRNATLEMDHGPYHQPSASQAARVPESPEHTSDGGWRSVQQVRDFDVGAAERHQLEDSALRGRQMQVGRKFSLIAWHCQHSVVFRATQGGSRREHAGVPRAVNPFPVLAGSVPPLRGDHECNHPFVTTISGGLQRRFLSPVVRMQAQT